MALEKMTQSTKLLKNWNECKLREIKERSYELPSVKSRIKKYQRDRYNFSCERSRCRPSQRWPCHACQSPTAGGVERSGAGRLW